MKVIVGLNNAGKAYDDTRHNVGSEVANRLKHQHRAGRWELCAPLYRYCTIRVGRTAVRLMRPLTMMNRSGDALREAVCQWRIEPEDLLIICDDVNLPLGTLRLRPGGSAGGHHGLVSCFEHLGTEEVPRLRLGVGVAPLPKDLTDFVLSRFTRSERPVVDRMIVRASEACAVWLRKGIDAAMNRYNANPVPRAADRGTR